MKKKILIYEYVICLYFVRINIKTMRNNLKIALLGKKGIIDNQNCDIMHNIDNMLLDDVPSSYGERVANNGDWRKTSFNNLKEVKEYFQLNSMTKTSSNKTPNGSTVNTYRISGFNILTCDIMILLPSKQAIK